MDVTLLCPTPDYVLDERYIGLAHDNVAESGGSFASATTSIAYRRRRRGLRQELGRAAVLRQLGARKSPSATSTSTSSSTNQDGADQQRRLQPCLPLRRNVKATDAVMDSPPVHRHRRSREPPARAGEGRSWPRSRPSEFPGTPEQSQRLPRHRPRLLRRPRHQLLRALPEGARLERASPCSPTPAAWMPRNAPTIEAARRSSAWPRIVTVDGGPAIWNGFVKPFVQAGEGPTRTSTRCWSDRYLIVDAAWRAPRTRHQCHRPRLHRHGQRPGAFRPGGEGQRATTESSRRSAKSRSRAHRPAPTNRPTWKRGFGVRAKREAVHDQREPAGRDPVRRRDRPLGSARGAQAGARASVAGRRCASACASKRRGRSRWMATNCPASRSVAGPPNTMFAPYGVGRSSTPATPPSASRGRIVFEAPGLVAPCWPRIARVEEAVLSKQQNRFKPDVARKWVELVYEGFFHDPLKTDLEAFPRLVAGLVVNGEVLSSPPAARVDAVAVRSPHILNAKGATYAQSADWGVEEAEGFIKLRHEQHAVGGGEPKVRTAGLARVTLEHLRRWSSSTRRNPPRPSAPAGCSTTCARAVAGLPIEVVDHGAGAVSLVEPGARRADLAVQRAPGHRAGRADLDAIRSRCGSQGPRHRPRRLRHQGAAAALLAASRGDDGRCGLPLHHRRGSQRRALHRRLPRPAP